MLSVHSLTGEPRGALPTDTCARRAHADPSPWALSGMTVSHERFSQGQSASPYPCKQCPPHRPARVLWKTQQSRGDS